MNKFTINLLISSTHVFPKPINMINKFSTKQVSQQSLNLINSGLSWPSRKSMQRAAQVRKSIFFSKSAAKKGQRDNEAYYSGRDLGGLEEDLIGLVAHRHVNHFFTTRLLANRFVYGTWSLVGLPVHLFCGIAWSLVRWWPTPEFGQWHHTPSDLWPMSGGWQQVHVHQQ